MPSTSKTLPSGTRHRIFPLRYCPGWLPGQLIDANRRVGALRPLGRVLLYGFNVILAFVPRRREEADTPTLAALCAAILIALERLDGFGNTELAVARGLLDLVDLPLQLGPVEPVSEGATGLLHLHSPQQVAFLGLVFLGCDEPSVAQRGEEPLSVERLGQVIHGAGLQGRDGARDRCRGREPIEIRRPIGGRSAGRPARAPGNVSTGRACRSQEPRADGGVRHGAASPSGWRRSGCATQTTCDG